MEENKKGGKRPGAGRKPVDNPKVPITLYVAKKSISPFGNEEKLKTALYGFIDGKKLVPEPVDMVIQDLTKPTHQIKPQETPKTNYAVNIEPKPVSPIQAEFEAFKVKIKACTWSGDLQAIMKEVKTSLLAGWMKKQLDELALEQRKEFQS